MSKTTQGVEQILQHDKRIARNWDNQPRSTLLDRRKKVNTMKTLEDRLRVAAREKARHWCAKYHPRFEADLGEKTIVDIAERLALDVLAIVADAPRIYRGEEILSHEGELFWCIDEKEVVEVYQGRARYADAAEYQVGVLMKHATYFGPLPTNSPSEGKG